MGPAPALPASTTVVRRIDDVKIALVLSSAFAIAATSTVPLLLPSLPPEARSLPLPLPVFCAVLSVQLLILYGLLGFVGLRLARSQGLEPTPFLPTIWNRQPTGARLKHAIGTFAAGVGCGVFLLAAVAAIQRFVPGTLPTMLHPRGMAVALLASAAGSFGEEILFRLFALSLLLRMLPKGRLGMTLAVGISALAFACAHAPAMVFLFGGWQEVPRVSWVWLLALNGTIGLAFGAVYLRYGIAHAILAHFSTDLVWHVASQLPGV
jgi:hypothetical protein